MGWSTCYSTSKGESTRNSQKSRGLHSSSVSLCIVIWYLVNSTWLSTSERLNSGEPTFKSTNQKYTKNTTNRECNTWHLHLGMGHTHNKRKQKLHYSMYRIYGKNLTLASVTRLCGFPSNRPTFLHQSLKSVSNSLLQQYSVATQFCVQRKISGSVLQWHCKYMYTIFIKKK